MHLFCFNLPSENEILLSVAGLSQLVKNTREFLLSSVYSLPSENVFFCQWQYVVANWDIYPLYHHWNWCGSISWKSWVFLKYSVIATLCYVLCRCICLDKKTIRAKDRPSQEQGTNDIKKVFKRQTIPLQGSQIHNAQWKEKSFFGLTAHGVTLDNHCQNHLWIIIALPLHPMNLPAWQKETK